MVLPYTIGVVLDDLAQPPSYGSASHSLALEVLLQALRKKQIDPELPMVLQIFPKNFEKIIQLSRHSQTERVEVEEAVVGLIGEIFDG